MNDLVRAGNREGAAASVTVREVSRENWTEAFALSVHPEQLHFISEGTPPVAIALAKAYIRPSGLPAIPYAIYAGSDMVGYFNLVYEPESIDNYWIFHYFIDRRFQGRGLGKAGINALIELLRFNHPKCSSVALTVHPQNAPAQRLYRGCGFKPTGEIAFEEPVYRLALSRSGGREAPSVS